MICIDGIIFSLQQNGGISIYFTELLKRLTERRIGTDLIVYKNRKNNDFLKPINLIEKEARYLERYRNCIVSANARIFHSSYYRLPQKKNIPIITTVHDFTYEKFVSGPRKWVHSVQKKCAIKNADTIICVSNNTKNDLLTYNTEIDESKIVVIHNGVSDHFYPIKDDSLITDRYILFVGQRSGYKNFRTVVIALKQLPDFKLYCVGGGNFSRDELSFLNQLIPDRFRFLGYLTGPELNIVYNGAFCLLYPSLYEGFGIPVIEAMKAGCPVIAFSGSSISEISDNAAILLTDVDPDSIIEAIDCLSMQENRRMYIEKGFLNASKYSWNIATDKIIDVYRKYINI